MDYGRGSSFEVTVNDKFLAYSKLSTGRFPDFRELAKVRSEPERG